MFGQQAYTFAEQMRAETGEKAVWLQSRSITHFRYKTAFDDGVGTTEQSWSGYKRFQVDMRLLDEPAQEVPTANRP